MVQAAMWCHQRVLDCSPNLSETVSFRAFPFFTQKFPDRASFTEINLEDISRERELVLNIAFARQLRMGGSDEHGF